LFVVRGWMLSNSVAMGDLSFLESAPSAHQQSYPHQQKLATVSTENDAAE